MYRALKVGLAQWGYGFRGFVISGRCYWFDNKFLVMFRGASRNSRHLHGDAIDLCVLDVNGDGVADRQDVAIVYEILDKELIRGAGGIGTYWNEADFFSRQMVHFNLRGHRARWHR